METQHATPQTTPAAIYRDASEPANEPKPRVFRGYDAGDVHEEARERRTMRAELWEDEGERRYRGLGGF